VQTARPTPPRQLGTSTTWSALVERGQAGSAAASLAEDLRWLTARVQEVVAAEPLLVDLSTDTDFAVVKVVVPGTLVDIDRIHPNGNIPDHIAS
jgi:ribosomal protein S12 methylthiotransferase accessory factor